MSSKSERIVVAMSGGVDSSCAACILKKEGFEVIGVFLSCCSLEGIADARLVAEKLDIPFYVLDFHKEFKQGVIDYFSREYLNARTPNPCILCNQKIKFGALLRKAKELGAQSVATGHYAMVNFDKRKKRFLLKEGIDKKKDQSYNLFSLTQAQLAHIKFPLANRTKSWVRNCTKKLGLAIYAKKDSQEVCFIEDDYKKFLKKKFPDIIKPGPILDQTGRQLGIHKGIAFYTIGQREGLGIPYKYPLYVIKIDKEANKVIVGPRKNKFSRFVETDNINWIIEPKRKSIRAKVKIRYQHTKTAATLNCADRDSVRIEFSRPQESPAPGQAAVFYDRDLVLGGGWIV